MYTKQHQNHPSIYHALFSTATESAESSRAPSPLLSTNADKSITTKLMAPTPTRTINIALNPQSEKHIPIAAYHHFGCFHSLASTNSTAPSTPRVRKPVVRRESALQYQDGSTNQRKQTNPHFSPPTPIPSAIVQHQTNPPRTSHTSTPR